MRWVFTVPQSNRFLKFDFCLSNFGKDEGYSFEIKFVLSVL